MKLDADIYEQTKLETQELLVQLINIPSTRGNEGLAIRYLYEALAPYVEQRELIYVDDSIIEDPDYAFRIPGISYEDTPNLECTIRGREPSGSILFNTHLDVVPPSEGQENAFSARIDQGVIFGRGACDAKGQVVTLFALAKLLKEHKILPNLNLVYQLVFEEENGGNGTLAMVRRGVQADAAIVLEPSELAVISAVRGAVWFHLKTLGQSGHSGSKGSTVSALKTAVQAMEILEGYHDRLLEESRGHPLFDAYEDPMPITFGECKAGRWPASVPSEAIVRGVLGFLPNKNRFQVQEEMRTAICSRGDAWLKDHFELTFPMLNSDGYSLPEGHTLVKRMVRSVKECGLPGEVRAMTAACDAWYYNNQAGVPTVVFGPGSLSVAHSKDERIQIDEIMKAAEVLMDFVQNVSRLEESNE